MLLRRPTGARAMGASIYPEMRPLSPAYVLRPAPQQSEFVLPISMLLSRPTDLLHYWSLRAPARGSTLNAVTLYRVSDAAQADFAFDARGRLPLAAIQAWAGASSGTTQVRVARVWDSSATQLGSVIISNISTFTEIVGSGVLVSATEYGSTSSAGGVLRRNLLTVGKTYQLTGALTTAPGLTASIHNSAGTSGNVVVSAVGTTVPFNVFYTAIDANIYLMISAPGNAQVSISIREVLTANAVQTTVASMPFIDLATGGILGTSGSSLVATLPAQISSGKMLRIAGGNLYEAALDVAAGGTYTVQSAQTLQERIVLKSDTPEADIEKIRRAARRAWKASEVYLGPELLTGTPADWSTGNTLPFTATATNESVYVLQSTIYPTPGKCYRIEVELANVVTTSTGVAVYTGCTSSLCLVFPVTVVSGTFTRTLVPNSTALRLVLIRLLASAGTSTTATINRVSVREVIGGI